MWARALCGVYISESIIVMSFTLYYSSLYHRCWRSDSSTPRLIINNVFTGVGGLSLAPPDGMWARALYDYDATSNEELSFIEGELIKILRKVGIKTSVLKKYFYEILKRPFLKKRVIHIHQMTSPGFLCNHLGSMNGAFENLFFLWILGYKSCYL